MSTPRLEQLPPTLNQRVVDETDRRAREDEGEDLDKYPFDDKE